MRLIKEYWVIILMAISIVSSTTTAQIQVASNSEDIKDIKEGIKKLDDQRTEQAVMKANQENIKDDLREIKDLLRELKK